MRYTCDTSYVLLIFSLGICWIFVSISFSLVRYAFCLPAALIKLAANLRSVFKILSNIYNEAFCENS